MSAYATASEIYAEAVSIGHENAYATFGLGEHSMMDKYGLVGSLAWEICAVWSAKGAVDSPEDVRHVGDVRLPFFSGKPATDRARNAAMKMLDKDLRHLRRIEKKAKLTEQVQKLTESRV